MLSLQEDFSGKACPIISTEKLPRTLRRIDNRRGLLDQLAHDKLAAVAGKCGQKV